MSKANIAVWDTLLCAQQRMDTQGHLQEIGVFKDLSASVHYQHKRAAEELWLVNFCQGFQLLGSRATPRRPDHCILEDKPDLIG